MLAIVSDLHIKKIMITQIYMKIQEQNSSVLKQRIFCPPHVPRNILSKEVLLSRYTSSQEEPL